MFRYFFHEEFTVFTLERKVVLSSLIRMNDIKNIYSNILHRYRTNAEKNQNVKFRTKPLTKSCFRNWKYAFWSGFGSIVFLIELRKYQNHPKNEIWFFSALVQIIGRRKKIPFLVSDIRIMELRTLSRAFQYLNHFSRKVGYKDDPPVLPSFGLQIVSEHCEMSFQLYPVFHSDTIQWNRTAKSAKTAQILEQCWTG